MCTEGCGCPSPQVQHSMDAGRKEMFLPRDFRFSHRTGGKLVSSKLWAYPVTGVIEDLIPFTPESHSETNLPPIAVVQEPSHVSKNRYDLIWYGDIVVVVNSIITLRLVG